MTQSLTEFKGPGCGLIVSETGYTGGRRCVCTCLTPPGICSAGGSSRPLIGRRASGGGSDGHTNCIAYIKQALGANQLVVAAPVTGSLVCFNLFSHRDITRTVNFPWRRTAGGTDWILQAGYQVLLQVIAEYCNMDAVSLEIDNRAGKTFEVHLYVPWDAPEAVVDVSSSGVTPLRNLPDVIGLVGRRDNATESHILQGRDPRSIRVLVPDCRGLDQNFHDVTIVDMCDLPESHVSMPELAELIHKWPPAVINHMMWRQRELEQMRKTAKREYRQKPCTFCGRIIKTDMYRHVARRHLKLVQLW